MEDRGYINFDDFPLDYDDYTDSTIDDDSDPVEPSLSSFQSDSEPHDYIDFSARESSVESAFETDAEGGGEEEEEEETAAGEDAPVLPYDAAQVAAEEAAAARAAAEEEARFAAYDAAQAAAGGGAEARFAEYGAAQADARAVAEAQVAAEGEAATQARVAAYAAAQAAIRAALDAQLAAGEAATQARFAAYGAAQAAVRVTAETRAAARAAVEASAGAADASPAAVEASAATVEASAATVEAAVAPTDVDDEKKKEDMETQKESGKRKRESVIEDEAESHAVCPICMDQWTNCGDHRLVCLRCGHLFGYSCLVRWLEVGCFSGQRRCPQCNKKAHKRDIRTLYVHNLQVLDTTECEKLKEELTVVKQEKLRMEMELARVNLNSKLHAEELKLAQTKIKKLEADISHSSRITQQSSQQASVTRMILENSLEISPVGGCRVLTYNSFHKQLYVSYNSSSSLFPGFCVRLVEMSELRPVFGRSVFLHTKAIRDLALRPQSHDILLSVSLDKTAKLFDLSSNGVINKFSLESPGWSCCWDTGNLNNFFIGCQNGSMLHYDSRQPTTPLNHMTIPGDSSAVTSMTSLPYCAGRVLPQGGLLVSRLTSCWAYAISNSGDYQGQQLPMEGPFTSVCHDRDSDNILISRRPNASNPNICHILCQLEQEGSAITCNAVHTFLGGTAQMQLSRPCFMKIPNDTLVTAYVESNRSINAWSIASGQIVATVRAHDPVKDLCSFNIEDRPVLCALSEKALRIYSIV